MHTPTCTPRSAHFKCPLSSVRPQVHILRVHIPQVHIPKCTFPSAHSSSAQSPVHIRQCTFQGGHFQMHIPKCTPPSTYSRAHNPKVPFPKCTVTQNRCAGRTGAIQQKVLANPTKDTSLIGCSWRSTAQHTELGSPPRSPKFTNAQKANR